MRQNSIYLALLLSAIFPFSSYADDSKPSDEKRLVNKLSKMKPKTTPKGVEKQGTAPVLLYKVDASALAGKPAAICDIKNCRIALIGVDVSKIRPGVKSLHLRVTGGKPEKQTVKLTDDKILFLSNYDGKKARCQFHNFKFELTDRLLSYGPINKLGFRNKGTLWANETNSGILVIVDASTGKFTTHGMLPKSKRVELE
jgi:hypothetical protein